jgi:hypothetical protein
MSAPRPGVLVVMTDIPPEEEERFNHWYDTEHVPERVSVPGVRRARRYVRYDDAPQPPAGTVAASRGPKYLVIYELDDVDVLHGAWAEVAARRSDVSVAIYPLMTNLVREAFVEIGDFEGGDGRARP